jgi:meiotic recombination protein REC8
LIQTLERPSKSVPLTAKDLLISDRPDQLMIVDDPAFAIDNALPPLDLELWDADNMQKGGSLRSSQSMLSMRLHSGSSSSMRTPSVLGLDISASSNGVGVYQVANNPFGGSSTHNHFNGAFSNDEDMLVIDDDLFDFDAEGNMRDIVPGEHKARYVTNMYPIRKLLSANTAIERVRREHEDGRALQIIDGDGDFDMQYGEDYPLPPLLDIEPFPVMSGALGTGDRALHLNDEDHILSDPELAPSSDAAKALQKAKREHPAKKAKVMRVDSTCEFRNADLISWDKGYLQSMDAKILVKKHRDIVKNSKKVAFQFVYGAGLNDVGIGIGSEQLPNPLAMFSGAALLENITSSSVTALKGDNRGTKRPAASSAGEQSSSRKRPAPDIAGEVSRGLGITDHDFFHLNDDFGDQGDQSIEVGRDAPSPLADYPSSVMPWNRSESRLSHQQGQPSSRLGSVVGTGVARRLTSASPLLGRGSSLPHDFSGDRDEMVIYGRSDTLASPSQHDHGAGGVEGVGGGVDPQAFELFGPVAAVDTQTAEDSQWIRSVLDRESENFFEYVKNSIDEKFGPDEIDELGNDFDIDVGLSSQTQRKSQGRARGKEVGVRRAVGFEEIFIPEQSSCIVAAQAFFHILTLTTKQLIWVKQDNGVGKADIEPFGEIWVGVV